MNQYSLSVNNLAKNAYYFSLLVEFIHAYFLYHPICRYFDRDMYSKQIMQRIHTKEFILLRQSWTIKA